MPLDANHCPGACMLLFKLPDGRQYLHTGDMRFHERFKESPLFTSLCKKLSTVFLDTTYAEPKHNFPLQEKSIAMVVDKIKRFRLEHDSCRVLVLIAAYNIGNSLHTILCSDSIDRQGKDHQTCVKGTQGKSVHHRKESGHCSVFEYVCIICLCDHQSIEDDELSSSVTQSMREANDIHVCHMGLIGEIWPYWQVGHL